MKNRTNSLKGGENSFEHKFPELSKEWHPTMNGDLKPSDITPNYGLDVWWYCDKCKQPWQRSPASRIRGDKGCPICSGRKYCRGINDVATICPEIVPAWHPTLNDNRRPEDYRYHDTTKVYWICTSCGKESFGSIYDKVQSRSPLCKGCKISETYSKKRKSFDN